jgi:hypothetical protein
VWEQPIGTYPVDFVKQGDEWTYHLAVELTGNKHINARGTDGSSPVEIGPPMSGSVTSKLHVSRHAEGITCVVVGDGETVPADQVEPWRRAAEAAVTLLGRRNQDFEWEAVVGTHPFAPRPDLLGALGTPQTIGPVSLSPGGACMREYQTQHEYLIDQHGFGVSHSFPIIASGRVTAHDWDPVVPTAMYCLRRICAVLTLCPGRLWIPRTRPRQLIDGQDSLKVPTVSGLVQKLPGHLEEPEWRGTIPAGTPVFELPDWIESAWRVLDDDRELATAINAYYEARWLDSEHPSIAFATYVAAIEGYGARFVPDGPCDCHPQCTHPKPTAQKRFKKALRTVMSGREVQRFARPAYGVRSDTDHAGSLFGSEHVLGYPYLRLFQQTNDIVFDYALLLPLRKACRDVLFKALQDACTSESGHLTPRL